MRYLITGATGFIGGNLAGNLAAQKSDAHVICRDMAAAQSQPWFHSLTCHRFDGTLDSITTIVKEVQPDVVVHLASCFIAEHKPTDIENIIASNITFGTYLLEAMTALAKPRIVAAGTAWQHFNDSQYDPVCLYAASKQAFEDILRFYINAKNFSAITLKLFDTYGPHDPRRKLIPSMVASCHNHQPLQLSAGEQRIDLVHVDDVVSAIKIACQRIVSNDGIDESYAISSGRTVSLKELAALFSQSTGLSPQIEWGVRPYRMREVMMPWLGGKHLPNWRATIDLEKGLADCVENV